MQNKEERKVGRWRIVCNISPVTHRTRYTVWSDSGVNMKSFDTEIAAERWCGERP
jgi:hypothetical protein